MLKNHTRIISYPTWDLHPDHDRDKSLRVYCWISLWGCSQHTEVGRQTGPRCQASRWYIITIPVPSLIVFPWLRNLKPRITDVWSSLSPTCRGGQLDQRTVAVRTRVANIYSFSSYFYAIWLPMIPTTNQDATTASLKHVLSNGVLGRVGNRLSVGDSSLVGPSLWKSCMVEWWAFKDSVSTSTVECVWKPPLLQETGYTVTTLSLKWLAVC